MNILLIDNNDSFTYNLYHLINKQLDTSDKLMVANSHREISEHLATCHRIVLSPGPGLPQEFPEMISVLQTQRGATPILGVCLGHQAIAEHCGAQLKHLSHPFHGIKSNIKRIAASHLLDGLPPTFEVARYHSWVVDSQRIPSDYIVTAIDSDGEIMAAEVSDKLLFGVQFHPESFLTAHGATIISNFLRITS